MLAIAGGKGGCGKTTTTHRLAVALARRGETPLAVDADAEMPDLHVVADVPAGPGLPAVAAGRRPTAVAHRTGAGVRVLPADGIEATAVPAALRRLRAVDGPVLLDCPAGAGRDATRPLRAADRALLVTTPTPASLRDTVKTAAMARAVGADPLGVVLADRTTVETASSGTPVEQPHDTRRTAGRRLTDADARRLFDCPLVARVGPADADEKRPQTASDGYAGLAKEVRKHNI